MLVATGGTGAAGLSTCCCCRLVCSASTCRTRSSNAIFFAGGAFAHLSAHPLIPPCFSCQPASCITDTHKPQLEKRYEQANNAQQIPASVKVRTKPGSSAKRAYIAQPGVIEKNAVTKSCEAAEVLEIASCYTTQVKTTQSLQLLVRRTLPKRALLVATVIKLTLCICPSLRH
jgi:hypothetical protein